MTTEWTGCEEATHCYGFNAEISREADRDGGD